MPSYPDKKLKEGLHWFLTMALFAGGCFIFDHLEHKSFPQQTRAVKPTSRSQIASPQLAPLPVNVR